MQKSNKIRGVNLGGWLVLEQWMTPYLYTSSGAADEYNILKTFGEGAREMFRVHRDTFITEDDFKWLSQKGVNSVRLPVGHWSFNGTAPYFENAKYIDWTFEMAEKYEIPVLLDIHAAPGCQNGFDNGGLSGIMDWHKSKENIDRTVEFAGELAKRYKDSKMLHGLQLLNEPHWDVPMDILQQYYIDGYKEARKYIDEDKMIVIHDGFRLTEWKEFMRGPEYKNVILDTHFYQCFKEEDVNKNQIEHIVYAVAARAEQIDEMQAFFPIIVGEWSLGLNPNSLGGATGMALEAILKAYANSQLVAFERAYGWYFWSYKLNNNVFTPSWCFKDAVEQGYMPSQFKY